MSARWEGVGGGRFVSCGLFQGFQRATRGSTVGVSTRHVVGEAKVEQFGGQRAAVVRRGVGGRGADVRLRYRFALRTLVPVPDLAPWRMVAAVP